MGSDLRKLQAQLVAEITEVSAQARALLDAVPNRDYDVGSTSGGNVDRRVAAAKTLIAQINALSLAGERLLGVQLNTPATLEAVPSPTAVVGWKPPRDPLGFAGGLKS